MTPSENIENFKEITEVEKIALEESDAKWERPPQLFIDQFNARCVVCSSTSSSNIAKNTFGRYNEDTGFFELNGLTDITYEQAVEIMKVPNVTGHNTSDVPNRFLNFNLARTLFPFKSGSNTTMYALFMYMPNLEVVYITNYYITNNGQDIDTFLQLLNNTREMFYIVPKLREVRGVLKLSTGDAQGVHFYNCSAPALETIWLQNLCLDINHFKNFPKLKTECIAYMVEHAGNTKAITITLHPNVYAQLTDEIIVAAADKQITFATI